MSELKDLTQAEILTTLEDRVWTIRLNRPEKRNALNIAAIEALQASLKAFRDCEEAWVCVITTSDPRAFCTGIDLKSTNPPDNTFAEGYFAPDVMATSNGYYIRAMDISWLGLKKPVIAAVNGYALGGGFELALSCDICIASDTAVFSLPEVKIGSIPAVGGILELMRTLGKSTALEVILTGRRISVEEAHKWGVVSEIVPSEALDARAQSLAREIAQNAPLAVRAALMLAKEGRDLPAQTALKLEQLTFGTLRDTQDRREGRRAFAEKRAPVFQGR